MHDRHRSLLGRRASEGHLGMDHWQAPMGKSSITDRHIVAQVASIIRMSLLKRKERKSRLLHLFDMSSARPVRPRVLWLRQGITTVHHLRTTVPTQHPRRIWPSLRHPLPMLRPFPLHRYTTARISPLRPLSRTSLPHLSLPPPSQAQDPSKVQTLSRVLGLHLGSPPRNSIGIRMRRLFNERTSGIYQYK
ncbi:hypothetical protein ARMGADRAFT_124416 [Armillaria gallica]|uniref:Uncharacterized protein n=1 Tax=Armillaria gallica TaxID=47427 RepID=A0A2H3DDV9_ARMGA|nr:hypothetical protein ARMGADRAFT_124416 [Armillaria gallica]